MSRIPEPWATRMVERGYTDRRSIKSAVPSYGALADAFGVNTTTISETIAGKRTPSIETVEMLMTALGSDVADWLGFKHRGPWEPPRQVALLDPRQRAALDELIRAFTATMQGGDGDAEDDRSSAPIQTPATGPAQQPVIVDEVLGEPVNDSDAPPYPIED